MVDEYQDIDAVQAKLIYMLSSHRNLIAVGDDDQAIYGFRGGSSKFMLTFKDTFPEAEIVILKENFRATQSLVAASQKVISTNNDRIQKEVSAMRGKGNAPVYYNGTDVKTVEDAVNKAVKLGYSYSDIAILSPKNVTLENLNEHLTIPTVLEKSYLVDDPLFAGIYFSLLFRKNQADNTAMLHLCTLFDVDPPQLSNHSLYKSILQDTGYHDISDLEFYSVEKAGHSYQMLKFLSNISNIGILTPGQYVTYVAYALGLETSASVSTITDLIKENQPKDLKQFLELLVFMVRFEDDTKVAVSTADAVLLITNHESKGREFPVVILVDESFSDEDSDESVRLRYVAMTRAEDHLFILRKAG